MTETVVHVTTLSQWHNVLDIWFGQGYSWNTGSREYKDIFFQGWGCKVFTNVARLYNYLLKCPHLFNHSTINRTL